MEFSGYLAMTGAEIAGCATLPPKIAYMSCHFSPYGTGLSGIPSRLPPGSMLMLTDRTPVCGHDPQRIAQQLGAAVEQLECGCVLLDFQRPGSEEAAQIASVLTEALPCPVGVTEDYAQGLACPVLLSPPLWTPLGQHLRSWPGRELWLEAALEGAAVTVTESGSRCAGTPWDALDDSFTDDGLHIAYRFEALADRAEFYLRRDVQQLEALLREAQTLGIRTVVGLYQQLCP